MATTYQTFTPPHRHTQKGVWIIVTRRIAANIAKLPELLQRPKARRRHPVLTKRWAAGGGRFSYRAETELRVAPRHFI